MKTNTLVLRLALCAIPVLWAVAPARAQYSGEVWLVSDDSAGNAGPTNPDLLTAANITFTASAVDFSSYGNIANTGNGSLDYTFNSFLTSLGSATTVTDVSPAGIGNMSMSAGSNTCAPESSTCYGFLMEITGTAAVTNGESFTVSHDDGLTLTIGGDTVVNAPGPTADTVTTGTYTGATGNEAFTLIYGECCGAPAVLETTIIPATVPEPGTVVELGSMLLGLGLLVGRKFRKA